MDYTFATKSHPVPDASTLLIRKSSFTTQSITAHLANSAVHVYDEEVRLGLLARESRFAIASFAGD